jgi:hypothetical protein
MQLRNVLAAVAGPAAFFLAAFVGGKQEPGYVARDEPISALAAHGTKSARVMVPGFLGLAGGTLALAAALRGSKAAPTPVPAMLALSGLTVAGAGLARTSDRSCPTRGLNNGDPQLTDDVHMVFSAATFALWIATPLVAAARARDASAAYRVRSARNGLTTLGLLMGGGMLARRADTTWSGTAQRAMLGSAFSWYLLAGFES